MTALIVAFSRSGVLRFMSVIGWLRTNGNKIVDASDRSIILRGFNVITSQVRGKEDYDRLES